MIVQSLSADRYHHSVKLKTLDKYAAVNGTGYWLKVLIKCLVKLLFKPEYYNGKTTMGRNKLR